LTFSDFWLCWLFIDLVDIERVEGFSVFKGSDSVPVVTDEGSEQEENNQKELNRQNEVGLSFFFLLKKL
jgi:hypothetical protein